MRILAVSGSLRATSSNTRLLRAMATLAPQEVAVTLYEGLAGLPQFNPDLDGDETLRAVMDYRDLLQRSDGVFFSSPEYAHGVPGSLKNALDWVVGTGELVGKPVGIINASPRSTYAHESLVETLTVMSARLLLEASATIYAPVRSLRMEEMLADREIVAALRSALAGMQAAIELQPSIAPE